MFRWLLWTPTTHGIVLCILITTHLPNILYANHYANYPLKPHPTTPRLLNHLLPPPPLYVYHMPLRMSERVLMVQEETTMPAVKAAAAAARAIVGAVVFVPALAGGVVLEQKSVLTFLSMPYHITNHHIGSSKRRPSWRPSGSRSTPAPASPPTRSWPPTRCPPAPETPEW
jgi:hypothetical protein